MPPPSTLRGLRTILEKQAVGKEVAKLPKPGPSMFAQLLILINNLSYFPAVRLCLEIFQEQILETRHFLLG